MITYQKAFDTVWEHFIVGEGEPSGDEDNCVYNPDPEDYSKQGCAFQVCIPVEHRHHLVESTRASECRRILRSETGLRFEGDEDEQGRDIVEDIMGDFWDDLQQCHDDAVYQHFAGPFRANMEHRLRRLAKSDNLLVPPVSATGEKDG